MITQSYATKCTHEYAEVNSRPTKVVVALTTDLIFP